MHVKARFLAAMAALSTLLAAPAAEAQLNFNAPIVTSPTQGLYNGGTWYTDRYAPAAFENTTWQSRNDVLRIGIDESGNKANRGGAFSADFYATQGRKYDLGQFNTGRFFLSADLWVDQSWQNSDNGFRRTDMWGVGSTCNDANTNPGCVTAYPIIGFTNQTADDLAFSGFRYWNGAGWTNTAAGVNYNGWNTLGIELDVGANLFNYFVNGTMVGSFNANGTLFMDAAIMQAFNFGQDFSNTLGNNTSTAYSAYWANSTNISTVPEPSTSALMAAGLGMFLAAVSRRRKQLKAWT